MWAEVKDYLTYVDIYVQWGDKLKYGQMSFIEPMEKGIKEPETYDATICDRCLCNKCIYSVAIYPHPTKEETETLRQEESCFNCDDCFYYGMDNESLSKGLVKFKCDRFRKSNHYIEKERRHIKIEAEIRRKKLRII